MLVSLVVIFLPLILDGEGVNELPGDLFSTPASQIKEPEDSAEPLEKATEYPLEKPTVQDLMPKEATENAPPPTAPSKTTAPSKATEPTTTAPTELTPVRKWNIQLATYARRALADALARRIRDAGHTTTVKIEHDEEGEPLFIVVLLKEGRYDEIESISRALDAQYGEIVKPIIRRRK